MTRQTRIIECERKAKIQEKRKKHVTKITTRDANQGGGCEGSTERKSFNTTATTALAYEEDSNTNNKTRDANTHHHHYHLLHACVFFPIILETRTTNWTPV